jgi:hypothetical protein
MKGWQVALLCLAVAALAVAGTLLFIRQTEDIPRYTADQVIAVAKAYTGGGCDSESWTTVYLGDGKWKVTIKCFNPEDRWWSTTVVSHWTFYEATGELKPG